IIKHSDKIVVSSEKVKDELVSINRLIDKKIIVLPFGIPTDMLDKPAFAKAIAGKKKYFLFVGMDHPIKNINFIKEAFNEFKKDKKYKDYKLYTLTKNVSREKLRLLYRNATALLTASHYESFNFPVLEALSQGCPVIGLKSAIIPELTPYVNFANNLDEFVENMKKIIIKPNPKSINQLYKNFNWENYVKNLVKLY
ncbi:MAG: glycosyltransferase, partial [Patescibacteria group bacterium]